jgi:uncharacterized protein YecT (DUF1311 family)
MKLIAGSVVAAALLAMVGCDNKPAGPPPPPRPPPGACSSPDSLDTLKRIVVSNIGKGSFVRLEKDVVAAQTALADGTAALAVEAVRTVSRDEVVGRSVCNAQLRLTVGPGAFDWAVKDVAIAAAVDQSGWKRDGQSGSLVVDVAYTAQLTDDKAQVYAELQNAEPVIEGAGLMAIMAWLAKTSGATQAAGTNGAIAQVGLPPPRSPADGAACAGVDMATTAGMLECAGLEFAAADARLNAVYKAAMARLSDDRQQALRAEQRAWVAARDPGCEAEATRDGMGGSAAALEMAGCRANRTEKRAAEVAAFK